QSWVNPSHRPRRPQTRMTPRSCVAKGLATHDPRTSAATAAFTDSMALGTQERDEIDEELDVVPVVEQPGFVAEELPHLIHVVGRDTAQETTPARIAGAHQAVVGVGAAKTAAEGGFGDGEQRVDGVTLRGPF